MRSLISESILSAGHSQQHPTNLCLLAIFNSTLQSFLGLLELCQPAYLQYRFLCLTHPRLALYQSASFCVFDGFMEWFVHMFYSTEKCFDLFHLLSFCLAYKIWKIEHELHGLSGWSQRVPSMTLIHTDLFCTLSIFSRFVCDTVVKLSITDNSEHHTMIHLEVLALFVEVQPQPSGLTSLFCTRVHLFPHAVCSFCLFSYRSIRCDCWYHLVSHCLCLVWTEDRSSVLASMWYFIQVVWHCFGCLLMSLYVLLVSPSPDSASTLLGPLWLRSTRPLVKNWQEW